MDIHPYLRRSNADVYIQTGTVAIGHRRRSNGAAYRRRSNAAALIRKAAQRSSSAAGNPHGPQTARDCSNLLDNGDALADPGTAVVEAIIVPRETKLIANLLVIENYRYEDGACGGAIPHRAEPHFELRLFKCEAFRHRQRSPLVGFQGNLLCQHDVARDKRSVGHETPASSREAGLIDLINIILVPWRIRYRFPLSQPVTSK
jgi:hypothetical protein